MPNYPLNFNRGDKSLGQTHLVLVVKYNILFSSGSHKSCNSQRKVNTMMVVDNATSQIDVQFIAMHNRAVLCVIAKSPVTNAFCNCPLSPVVQGPIVVTPLLRHMQSMTAATMSKSATPGTTKTYFHIFPELPSTEVF